MSLKVVAVAAPQFPEGIVGKATLNSVDPASLFNACRLAALMAELGRGAWGESNWTEGRQRRRDTLLLMHSLKDDGPAFERLLQEVEPNLLILGAMSLCLPGAVACAKTAKEMLGDRVCVVLGGWHASETIYADGKDEIVHHPGSPVLLMSEKLIDPVFDLVIAGEGEHVIPWLGERIADHMRNGYLPSSVVSNLDGLSEVPGRWIVAWNENGTLRATRGSRSRTVLDGMPPPCEMFGIRSSFDVFAGRMTAHVFSDSGNGCTYDCNFCSERRSIREPHFELDHAPQRLFQQLRSAVKVIQQDSPTRKASAFVEDSTLLAGSERHLRLLVDLLSFAQLDLRFGAQLTVDQILKLPDGVIRDLKSVGLDYLFVGIETPNPLLVGGFSKDVGFRTAPWISRTEHAVQRLSNIGIRTGAAVLFGLGENHESRLGLLQRIVEWQNVYGSPDPVSLNWAVQHPLKGRDGGTGYRYHQWGVPSGPWIDAFSEFGEASVHFPVVGQRSPILCEVQEITRVQRCIYAQRRAKTNT
ncbi:MAG: B12-binding domain/radical SAM domain-containing protein [Terriglobales bacterium]|jgi:B12-binding domain/radical SAM domain protein